MCADYEEQPVRLRLTDVNDEVPQFQNVPRPFLAMVSSDAPLGTSVYQLMANDLDRDSLIRYSLESGKNNTAILSFLSPERRLRCRLYVCYRSAQKLVKKPLRKFMK